MRIAVDSSALIAILKVEEDAETFGRCLGIATERIVSAPTYLETGIVAFRNLGSDGIVALSRLIEATGIAIVPLDREAAEVGLQAFRRFGRGAGHPAQLNFGDCFSCALARSRDLPLLFKGNDFIHTDIVPALRPA